MAGDARQSRRRIARTTAAVLTAGAVAAAPLNGLALAAPGDPIDIRLGVNERFARVEFAGPIGSRARVRRDGQTVVVRLGTTAAPDIALLRVNPPRGVASVETRAVQSATEIVLTLAEGADARFGQADGAAYVNIFPAGQAAEAPQADVVRVGAEVHGGVLTLDFDWRTPTPAAVFRREDAVWVVFDASARLDLEQPPAGLGPASDIRWVRGEDFTAVRISAPADIQPVARSEGGRWIVTLGVEGQAPEAPVTLARDDESGPTGMTAAVPGATRVLWIQDPTVGDRIGVITARGPSKGLEHGRRLVDMTLLPTAQGLALTPTAEDLTVAVDGDLVRISRPGGLHLSSPTAALRQAEALPEAPQAAGLPALVLSEWADLGEADFPARYRQLQTAAAEEAMLGESAPVEARLALARFLVGSGLHFEAIGVINSLVQGDERMGGLPEARGLRGAARAAIGRLAEAQADFASGPLTGDASAAVWRGYIAARQGEWEVARRAFSDGARAVDAFPPEWRTRFAMAHAEAALESGDPAGARALIDYALAQATGSRQLLEVRAVQARLFEAEGDTRRAAAIHRAISRAPFEDLAVPATLHATRLELAAGALTPAQAVQRMEPLRWRWRGDASELQVIRTLGGVYLSQGRYREALEVLRGAGTRLPDLPQAAELQADLSNAFRALFLEGAADGLQPIQAVALFEDFRELTPPGAEGDDMVRRLSRRLVDLDLLDRAAALLEYQVEHRLDGVAKASVATDAAAIRLINREPQKALENLWGSRTTLLPSALQAERRALEARALMMLGRYDHALEVLGSDASPAAQAVRADILWKQQDWAGAAGLYEAGLGARWENEAQLTAAEETQVTRAGIGYSLARDASALARLNQRYSRFIEGARSPDAMRLALATREDFSGLRDAQRLAESVDTFTGWVSQARARFRERTAEPQAASESA